MVRLYLPSLPPALPIGGSQAHYLLHVMRLDVGDTFVAVDGKTGAYEVSICDITKRELLLKLGPHLTPFYAQPPLVLAFGILKLPQMSFMVEKATELGVTDFYPLHTSFSNTLPFPQEKLEARIIEAVEQCERLDVPTLNSPSSLKTWLQGWNPAHPISWACERSEAERPPSHRTLLVGPPGGWSQDEKELLSSYSFVHKSSLSPLVLRSETAAIAGVSFLQLKDF